MPGLFFSFFGYTFLCVKLSLVLVGGLLVVVSKGGYQVNISFGLLVCEWGGGG